MNSEELLYFGTAECSFQHVPGTTYSFIAEDAKEVAPTPELSAIVSQRLKNCAYLGEDYARLSIPCIPATDIQINNKIPAEEAGKNNAFPNFLVKGPIMKMESGEIKGIQSGARSALLKTQQEGQSRWLRLKGCGNKTLGFNLEKTFEGNDNIRGCTFEHTAARELYYFDLVNKMIASKGFQPANIPIGWFEYQMDEKAPYPLVKRTCAVYECFGDKRLGDHLLYGIDLLLEPLVTKVGFKSLAALYPETRDPSDNEMMSTWWNLVVNEDPEFLDIVSFKDIKITAEDVPKPEQVSPLFDELWKTSLQRVQKAQQNLDQQASESTLPGNLVAALFWHLGRQVGIIQRQFYDRKMSWGTYQDSLGVHCNAHTNNVLVLPESLAKGDNLVAPLDFDMAFSKDAYIDEPAKFDEYLEQEVKAMKMELAAGGFSTGVRQRYEEFKNPEYRVLRWALRDTAVAGFLSGFKGQADLHPMTTQLKEGIHALIKLGLMMTWNDIA